MATISAGALDPAHVEKIAVIGAGYVGTPTAVLLAHIGHVVQLAERNASLRKGLSGGTSPLMEEGLDALLVSTQASGCLHIVESAVTAVHNARFVFLCVATPSGADGAADLSDLDAAIAEIAPHLMDGAVVITKSTVPVGTAERVRNSLDRPSVAVVSNPEFLREGSAVRDSFSPDRIVVGSDDESAALAVAALFSPTGAPVVATDVRSAEIIKYAANTFLATKISWLNDIARLCDLVGADISAVTAGVGHDPRIGTAMLSPGPGWGGSCLPKDVAAFLKFASDAGAAQPVVQAAISSNDFQRDHVVSTVRTLLGGSLVDARIAVLGLTFKANTSDRRHSPALDVVRALQSGGAILAAYDPTVAPQDLSDDLVGIELCDSVATAAKGALIIIVLTEWGEFSRLDFSSLHDVVAARIVFDVRNVVRRADVENAGFTLVQLGRPTRS